MHQECDANLKLETKYTHTEKKEIAIAIHWEKKQARKKENEKDGGKKAVKQESNDQNR